MLIRPADSEDVLGIRTLAAQAFGGGYLTEVPTLSVVAEIDSRLVGWGGARLLGQRHWRLEQVCVAAALQRNGIGTAIVEDLLVRISMGGGLQVTAMAWMREGRAAIGSVLTRLGFEADEIIPDYWKADSIERGYICPVCGPVCRCSACRFTLVF
jgi:ribosomal protein S18 acetylase RimI-like enzyme